MTVHTATSSQSADRVWRRSFSDSDEQAACVESLFPQRYHRIDAGPFAGEMTRIDLDGVVLVRERSNRRLIQEGSMNVLSIGWVPKRTGLFRCNGVDLEPQRVVLYGERDEFEIVCDACELIGVAIAPETITSFSDAVSVPAAKVSSGVRLVPPAIAASLHKTVSGALALVDTSNGPSPECREALRGQLIRLVFAIADLPDAEARRRCDRTYARVVGAAKRAMRSDLPRAITISELCQRIGVSRRNLFYAFEAVLGTSPYHYLKAVRLDAARHALKQGKAADSRIADVAWEFGFPSPSQFAADYKDRFGELPSETNHDSRP